ncbi:MAG TPA: uroporphyrinogen decarboxylase [Steroidobacteraceae bacterium]|nr:uroporphyrinogen decarboxylase [Steroidobacteraceae bacterium]
MHLTPRQRILAALDGKAVDRPPLWLMRQAGRYLPGYRAVRAEHSFWTVCKTPELSTQVALEPLALFPLDAAIVFSDILTIPDALGLEVTFGPGEGPRIGKRLRTQADLAAWNTAGLAGRLAFVAAAVKHLRAAIGPHRGLFGFAGGPWTLFSYIVEGQGSDDFRAARTLMHADPDLTRAALTAIADAVAELLEEQCKAGADVVQLFDTWGGLLTVEEYQAFALPAVRRITSRLRASGYRSLLFVRGGHHLLPVLKDAGVDGLSLDWRTSWTDARALMPSMVLQGNIDPILLLSKPDIVRGATRALLDDMRRTSDFKRCIVNLGHGIVPETPVDAVRALCDTVTGAA